MPNEMLNIHEDHLATRNPRPCPCAACQDQPRATPKPATLVAKALGCNCPKQDGQGQKVRMNCPVHGVTLNEPALRPKTSAERKAEPIHSGALMYFPDAIAAVARLSAKANEKHNPGQPLGWTRGKSADHDDCVVRHALTLEAIDPDTGEIEAVNRAWRALAALQLLEEKRLKAAGIMPYSGITP